MAGFLLGNEIWAIDSCFGLFLANFMLHMHRNGLIFISGLKFDRRFKSSVADFCRA